MNTDTDMSVDGNGTSQTLVAGPSSNESTKLFKLSIDCFDEIFDYLSVEDIHSIASTCKTMQRVVGLYFERNYPSMAKCMHGCSDLCLRKGNKQIPIPALHQFVQSVEVHQSAVDALTLGDEDSEDEDDDDDQEMPTYYVFDHLQSIESNITNAAIKRISFVEIDFDNVICESIENVLAKVETIELQRCYFFDDFHAKLLKFCQNLRNLNIHHAFLNHMLPDSEDFNASIDGNSWMSHQYPKLEHIKMIMDEDLHHVPLEIGKFLARHPNIRSFSTSSQCLYLFRDELLQCNSQLDAFKINKNSGHLRETIDFKTIGDIIKQLYARRFYKRLNIDVNTVDSGTSRELAQLPGLDKLCIKNFTGVHSLTSLVTLKKLAIMKDANPADMDVLAMSLADIEHVFLFKATFDDILPFIRRSMFLSKLKVFPKDEASFANGILQLSTLDKERGKLVGACKVMIYVPDNMFQKTKWTIKDGNTNLDHVEMQRYDLYNWGISF